MQADAPTTTRPGPIDIGEATRLVLALQRITGAAAYIAGLFLAAVLLRSHSSLSGPADITALPNVPFGGELTTFLVFAMAQHALSAGIRLLMESSRPPTGPQLDSLSRVSLALSLSAAYVAWLMIDGVPNVFFVLGTMMG